LPAAVGVGNPVRMITSFADCEAISPLALRR